MPKNKKEQVGSDTAVYSHKGYAQTNLNEELPTYNRGENEKVTAHPNGALIVLGRDRAADVSTGYGAKGDIKCARIDLIAGLGGYSAKETNNSGAELYSDPNFLTDASRLYMSQTSDIDDIMGLKAGTVGLAKRRSAIGLKADGLRFVAREGIKLVTGIDAKDSQGNDISKVSGIDLWAGCGRVKDKLEPLVKGKITLECLEEIVEAINDLNGIVSGFLSSQMEYNKTLAFHTHNSPFFGYLTTPSVDAVQGGIKCLTRQYSKTNVSLMSHKQNLVQLSSAYLNSHGEGYILSRYNNTN